VKPLAWITGAGGLIGQEILRTASQYDLPWQPRAIKRSVVDLRDLRAVESLFRKEQPKLLIHGAAISRTPACEANPALAREVNVEVTRVLADLAQKIPMVFLSTDLVFDGEKGNYVEEDTPNPLQVYGQTKLEAEKILQHHPEHTIIRISLTGGTSKTGDRGFNEELKNIWRAGRALDLFTDEYRCPMAAETPAKAIWELALKKARGIYHLNGAEKLSRFEMGQLIAARHPELNPKIVAASRKSYKGAPRPADTSFNCAKIERLLSFKIPKLSEWLKENPASSF